MNPFTWPGPQFIVAYLLLTAVVLVACYLVWRRSGEVAKPAKMNDLTSDPYRIAYLRGGAAEAARIAVLNLVDRGILEFDNTILRSVREETIQSLRRPLDRAIVEVCRKPGTLALLVANNSVRKAAQEYEQELGAKGLISAGPEFDFRKKVGFAAAGLLAGVALVKVNYALSTGRGNVGFLVMAAIVATVLALWITRRRLTHAGQQMLESVRTLLKRLKDNSDRIKPGGETNEALLLASAFGVYALSSTLFPVVEEMFPRPKSSSSSDGGSDGDSSSCSSSSCSSSSCGGGGGCGGCGS
jgi:uncharacterized protein (TIGR04222 family)